MAEHASRSEIPGEWRFPNVATLPGSSSYYSVRFAAPQQRDALALLHAWRARLRALPWSIHEPSAALAALNWWHEELQRILAGQPTHPLGDALAALIERHGLPESGLRDPIVRAEARIVRRVPATQTELIEDAARDQGALFVLIAHLDGITDAARLTTARRLGAYCSLVADLRESGWLLRQGWSGFLSGELWQAAGLDPAEALQSARAAQMTEALRTGIETINTLRAALDPATLPAAARIQVRLRDQLWRELVNSDAALFDARLALTPLHKLWHAWRAR